MEMKVLLIHPHQTESQESWENLTYRAYCISNGALKGKHKGINRHLETRVLYR